MKAGTRPEEANEENCLLWETVSEPGSQAAWSLDLRRTTTPTTITMTTTTTITTTAITKTKTIDGLYKYYYGFTTSYNEAKVLLKTAINSGFKSSFVTVFRDGKSYSLKKYLAEFE